MVGFQIKLGKIWAKYKTMQFKPLFLLSFIHNIKRPPKAEVARSNRARCAISQRFNFVGSSLSLCAGADTRWSYLIAFKAMRKGMGAPDCRVGFDGMTFPALGFK
ncbi:hypothetical protein DES40_1762 [Litorimonas taeanensis]|uniref:Uncharacterized protein n=1 Tax=Litorimonas taeanensis TaxID=568099 RepID=A0A420WDC1_9PROT|nr:hypothetical protein DES40_1762 [Litorimonas taeanensis]